MLSLQRTSYLAPGAKDNSTSLFLTAEFQGLARLLADTNSLPMLSGFLAGVVGTNDAMAEYSYINILRHNLRLSVDDIEKLTSSEYGHYNRTWMTEVLYQSLLQITQEHSVDGSQLQRLARCCASKIHKLHGKSPAYNFFSPASIACVQELSSYLQRVGISAHLGVDVITENSLKVLDNLSRYFALRTRQEFCLLLTFYGASYDKLPPACMSAALVRRILHGKAVQTPVRNLSAQESGARQLVSEAITTHLERTKKRLEYVEVIVNRRQPWYMLHRKLVQAFYSIFTLPRLREDYIALKRLDAVYKDSIMYGDCAKFFESLHNIKLMNIDRYKKHPELIAALRAVQSSYKVAGHAEYMATVRNCASQPRPVSLRCFTLADPKRSGVLGLTNQKVRAKMGTVSRWLTRQSHAARCKFGRNTGHYTTTATTNTHGWPESRVRGSAGGDNAVAVLRSHPSNDNLRLRTGTLLAHFLKLLSRKPQHRASSLTALNLCYANGIGHMLARGTRASVSHRVRRPVGTHTSRYLRESQRARSLLLHAESLCNLYAICADQAPGHEPDVESSPASNDHTKKRTRSFSALLPKISRISRRGSGKSGNFESLVKKRRLASHDPESMSRKCAHQGVDAYGNVQPSARQLPADSGHKRKCGISGTAERRMSPLRSVAAPSSNDNRVSESNTASSTTLAQPVSAERQRRKKKHRVIHALKKRLLWALCATHTGAAELPGSDASSITSEHSSCGALRHRKRRKRNSATHKPGTLILYVPSLTTNKAEGRYGRCARGVASEYASEHESTDTSCSQATLDDERTSCSR